MGLNIFIVGLRRSGTTIFWRMFQRDQCLSCFDEPFNPALRELPEPHPKDTRDKFIELYERDPSRFEEKFAPIHAEEELTSGLTADQLEYLDWLLAQGGTVVCDFTRCAFKVAGLYEADPSAVLVHLYRRPESVATSHLLPSGPETWRGRVGNLARRVSFWWRKRGYDNWGFETIIGESNQSVFGELLVGRGVDAERVYELPAVGRLLAYWMVAFETVERIGRELFTDRFLSISFESFCEDPQSTVEKVRNTAELGGEKQGAHERLSAVHPAKGPYQPSDERWRQIAAELSAAGLNSPIPAS